MMSGKQNQFGELLEILRASAADAWEAAEVQEKRWEFYFIRHRLDQHRCVSTREFEVKVYRKSGEGQFLGSAAATLPEDAGAEEMKKTVDGLCQDALYVRNPAYTLNPPAAAAGECSGESTDLARVSGDFLKAMAALPETETEDLNSYEIFVSDIRRRFLNSEGIDVTAVYPSSMVEAVVNARKDGHEIELYRLYHSGTCDAEQLKRDLTETLRFGRDKLRTEKTPALKKADLVLSTDAACEVYDWFISRMNAAMVVRRMSDWEIGKPVLKEFRGDRVTLKTLRTLPNSSGNALYDMEGAPTRDMTVMEAGVPVNFFGSRQFSQYLGLKDSFIPGNFEVSGGTATAEELRQGAFLEVVEFSDFQVNPLNGDMAGEIRLAYWHDGTGRVTPVSGGSVSGTLSELAADMRFTAESRQYNSRRIPAVTRLKGATVTGAE